MNGKVNVDARKVFIDALVGRSLTVKGLVQDHDEEIVKAGAQQLWDYLNGAGLEITVEEK